MGSGGRAFVDSVANCSSLNEDSGQCCPFSTCWISSSCLLPGGFRRGRFVWKTAGRIGRSVDLLMRSTSRYLRAGPCLRSGRSSEGKDGSHRRRVEWSRVCCVNRTRGEFDAGQNAGATRRLMCAGYRGRRRWISCRRSGALVEGADGGGWEVPGPVAGAGKTIR